jgi:hypothetical protein
MNKWLPESVSEYLRRVRAVVGNRRIFNSGIFQYGMLSNSKAHKFDKQCEAWGIDSTYLRLMLIRNGYTLVGVGPKNMREGDLICILFGCSVPVVFRPHSFSNTNGYRGEFRVELVGECFVYDEMEGEIFETLKSATVDRSVVEFIVS